MSRFALSAKDLCLVLGIPRHDGALRSGVLPDDLLAALAELAPGDTVLLIVRRGSGPDVSNHGDGHRLTPRQRLVLEHAADGLTNKQIASRLRISEGTVRKHLEHIYDRLRVTNRTAAVAALRRDGPAGGPALGSLPTQRQASRRWAAVTVAS